MTEVRRPRVLYVDDQEGNLVVFKAALRKHCDIWTTRSAKQALAMLDEIQFTVVVSDQRMEEMPGTVLLGEVKKKQPDAIRMLLTAYTDFDDVVAAINRGQVSRFISKPWEAQDLLAILVNATELYHKTLENRALTEQLVHRERLAAIGQVTSGLVHELGNVAGVLSVASEIRDQLAKGEDVTPELDILQRGIDKFLVLVESLRIYSKGGEQIHVVKKPIDLGKLVDAAAVLLKLFPQVRGLKKLDLVKPDAPVVVGVDAKKLEQVLINLVKNSAEACTPREGVVRIEAARVGDHAVIRVADNGPGMPPAIAAKVWEGFHSTKGDKGTGLGLVMCKKILEGHGGTISFESPPGGGCTFTLSLPLA